MELTASRRLAMQTSASMQPALAAALATGAAVAAIGQPLVTTPLVPSPSPARAPSGSGSAPLALTLSHLEPLPRPGLLPALSLTNVADPLPAPTFALEPAPRFVPAAPLVPTAKPQAPFDPGPQPLLEAHDPAPVALAQARPQVTPALSGPAPSAEPRSEFFNSPTRTAPSKPLPMVDESTWMMLSGRSGPDASGSGFQPGARNLAAASPATIVGERVPVFNKAAEEAAQAAKPASPQGVQTGLAAQPTDSADGISRYSQTEQGIAFSVPVQVNRTAMGTVPLLIDDGENISVKLADILRVLEPSMAPDSYQALSQAAAAQEYVTLNDLRSAGISAAFGDDDRLVLGTP